MKRVILSGCNGNMGKTITQCMRTRDDCTIVAGIDLHTEIECGFPVFSNVADCNVEADVLVDFSHPAALSSLLNYAVEKNLPFVIATTGISGDGVEKIKAASEKIPIFFTANMSIGVNLMVELAKKAASILQNKNFDIEIIEKHHNQKIDAPSGTALMLADAISAAVAQKPQYVYDRHSVRKKREPNEIGIHSVRGGTIAGEHEVLFAGEDEILSISHTATSKKVFAVGAINAAMFLTKQTPGLYNMADMIKVG